MALIRQLKTAGFRPKSRYDIFIDRLQSVNPCSRFVITEAVME